MSLEISHEVMYSLLQEPDLKMLRTGKKKLLFISYFAFSGELYPSSIDQAREPPHTWVVLVVEGFTNCKFPLCISLVS